MLRLRVFSGLAFIYKVQVPYMMAVESSGRYSAVPCQPPACLLFAAHSPRQTRQWSIIHDRLACPNRSRSRFRMNYCFAIYALEWAINWIEAKTASVSGVAKSSDGNETFFIQSFLSYFLWGSLNYVCVHFIAFMYLRNTELSVVKCRYCRPGKADCDRAHIPIELFLCCKANLSPSGALRFLV